MTTPVETLPPDATAEVAWERMRLLRIHHIVVVDSDRRVLGILSQRDLGGAHGASVRRNATVGELMTSPALTVKPDTTVREAANLLRGRQIGCLPVVKRRHPVGMVTATDLLELLGRGAERPVATSTRWTMKDRGPRGRRARATDERKSDLRR